MRLVKCLTWLGFIIVAQGCILSHRFEACDVKSEVVSVSDYADAYRIAQIDFEVPIHNRWLGLIGNADDPLTVDKCSVLQLASSINHDELAKMITAQAPGLFGAGKERESIRLEVSCQSETVDTDRVLPLLRPFLFPISKKIESPFECRLVSLKRDRTVAIIKGVFVGQERYSTLLPLGWIMPRAREFPVQQQPGSR